MAYFEDEKARQKIIEWYMQLLQDKNSELYDQAYNQLISKLPPKSYNKYDDTLQYFYYDIPLDDGLPKPDQEYQGEYNMLGRDYVKHPNANYRHLREMVQACWNARNVMPGERFDVDYKFKYDAPALALWLSNSFDSWTLDDAHRHAVQNYKGGRGRPKKGGRGRPKGARNKEKVFGQKSDLNDPFALDSLEVKVWVDEGKEIEEAEKALKDGLDKIPQNFDMSSYVTHPQLTQKQYINESQLQQVVKNVGDALRTYVDLSIKTIELQKPTIVELKKTDAPNIQLGVQHRHFPDLLAMCFAATGEGTRLNVWLHGPAGTGKSTAARNVSYALTAHHGREFPFYSLGALETGFQVLGYNDANGKYVTTQFRECFEKGGVICLDEQDSYTPSASLALNGALANGHCAFADKIVARHQDCIIIAGANTMGLGGTMEYVGRMKQDAAFLDRFVTLDWPIDEALEDHLCPNKNWLDIVRHCRQQVISKQIKGAMVTPRAAIYGDSLLRAGVSLDRVLKATIKKGMSDAQWEMIKPNQFMIEACQGKRIAA